MMKILVENGCYHLRNMGDVAMLQIMVDRLADLWPHAQIRVLTDEPELLRRYVPHAEPLSARGRKLWFYEGLILGGLSGHLPGLLSRFIVRAERTLQRVRPEMALALIRLRERARGRNIDELEKFIKAVGGADLLVVSGGGDLNDEFADFASTLLDVLRLAEYFKVPVQLFGQGVGPLKDTGLLDSAARVLPNVSAIYVRENLKAPALLQSLGVRSEQVVVTGDDAIEMAYRSRVTEPGCGIGVNLRLASYSALNNKSLGLLQKVLCQAADRYAADLLPIPISFHGSESDVTTIRKLLAGLGLESDGGALLDSPQRLIQQVARCRCVLTGSYHAAVFALSQGIPAVCLARSDYYIDKFQGLADQFGCGCEVLLLDESLTPVKLLDALERVWFSAERVRPLLLAAAAAQVLTTQKAYRRVCERFETEGVASPENTGSPGGNPLSLGIKR